MEHDPWWLCCLSSHLVSEFDNDKWRMSSVVIRFPSNSIHNHIKISPFAFPTKVFQLKSENPNPFSATMSVSRLPSLWSLNSLNLVRRRAHIMGASLSNLTDEVNGSGSSPGLGDIPESCVACAFMYLTPPEICNLARLNRAFRGAASSDAVWETKLPYNYQDLLDLLPSERYRNLSKKSIFALLSRPVPFDDGTKVGNFHPPLKMLIWW